MPEAKIGNKINNKFIYKTIFFLGFFCDVASSVFLSRLRNNLGYYLGITGKRLNGRELVKIKLKTWYIIYFYLGFCWIS